MNVPTWLASVCAGGVIAFITYIYRDMHMLMVDVAQVVVRLDDLKERMAHMEGKIDKIKSEA